MRPSAVLMGIQSWQRGSRRVGRELQPILQGRGQQAVRNVQRSASLSLSAADSRGRQLCKSRVESVSDLGHGPSSS